MYMIGRFMSFYKPGVTRLPLCALGASASAVSGQFEGVLRPRFLAARPRGGADDATRPDVEVEAGRSDADSAARPVAEEGAGGDAQEHPTSQTEVETLVPEPPRAGVEGVAEEESAPRAPVVGEARVSAPAEAQDEGVVAGVTMLVATESVVPVV